MTTWGQVLGTAALAAVLCVGVYVQSCWRRARVNRARRARVRVAQSNCRVVRP